MRIRFGSVLLLLFFMIFDGCLFNDENEEDPADYYVFIEQHSTSHGDLISGPEPPLLQIDFPTYNFNPETKTLKGLIDFEINDDLKVIFGSGGCLSGTAGGGCATGLSGIYQIPFDRGNFELLKLEVDGDVIFMYKNEVYSLAVGEEWKVANTRIDTIDVKGQLSISEITDIDRISNFGSLKKEGIIIWEW
ncbi:MAG: hypothetical protein ABFS16_00370 [Bacteroidota bacterium]